ncbi:hypothetical protein [Streptomyces antimycoticus]|uniref:hypothetical protein n=1 Tax=Streptomyces antimycoticus TaxID=68175 RepID=UPI00382F6B45
MTYSISGGRRQVLLRRVVPAIAAAGIGATGLLGCSGSGDTAGHDAKAAKAGKAGKAGKGVTSRDTTSAQGGAATLLHRATEAEAAVQAAEGTGPEPGASAPPPPDGLRRTGRPGAGRGSRSRRWAPSSSSPGARQAIIALRSSDDGGSPGGAAGPSPLGDARITVYNAEKDCQDQRVRACSLGLAGDPYVAYRPSNIVGRAWHGDVPRADCRIANGVTVTDEAGGHSSMWFRVLPDGKRMWVPGIRIRQDQVQYSTLPNCPG